MTLRHMEIFKAVCDEGCNSTKAAEKLHMTQPAISLAIKELEAYYGVHLFDRIGRRLVITDAGKRFLGYAVHIMDLFNRMETELRDWDIKGILRIGASITIGSQFMPTYVSAFSARYPGVDVRITVDQSDRLERRIMANELDFALIEGVAHDKSIVQKSYMEDRLSVVCPADGKWKQGGRMTLDEFTNQRFLLREHGSGTREVFDRVTEQAGLRIEPVWEAMSTTALVNAVISGLGIAVLPSRMVIPAIKKGLVVTVNVEGLSFLRSFNIIYHKDKFLSLSARRFMELCTDYEMDYPGMDYYGLF